MILPLPAENLYWIELDRLAVCGLPPRDANEETTRTTRTRTRTGTRSRQSCESPSVRISAAARKAD